MSNFAALFCGKSGDEVSFAPLESAVVQLGLKPMSDKIGKDMIWKPPALGRSAQNPTI